MYYKDNPVDCDDINVAMELKEYWYREGSISEVTSVDHYFWNVP